MCVCIYSVVNICLLIYGHIHFPQNKMSHYNDVPHF